MNNILQFKITLKYSNPKIWRRFLVPDNITFYDLHLIIQNVMGWFNGHLHQFIYEKKSYIGDPEIFESDDIADEKTIPLNEFFTEPKMQIMYEYDMGDSWLHELVFEKILEKEKGKYYPVCIAGEKNCPPEDCGSLPGFYNMLDTLKKKKGKEYKELMEWLGGEYNPEEFDLVIVNENLKDYKSIDFEMN
ncbi:MAG: plasmid pRiA4b ORF-3 family protein [Ignavibacteriales bacterium]|nr:plasmid pRiA4b ORF-3 family protein [Ignavibacteriales bacterium]